ncbi:MAG: chromosomal replication initiator protein DnaA [Candidatus Lindowbacteria bacterium]|nr:chromosomal replication initiator protein DnaA [Candidatus Lindowbacteria bacterium]
MRFSYSDLNPQYTFDNFVVGSCNLFAHSAAKGVAEKPAELYNPLFIYGGVGLGKTHLMQAIGHRALVEHPRGLKAAYLSTESFTNQLIAAIQNRATEEFRQKFRTIDFLLIDDIHFIAGKDATQEEFFHTFNALHDKKKQIVISSDRPPKQIPTLEERLVSRFEWGLVASLEPPDFDTRVAILRKKAENMRVALSPEVFDLIAQHISSNIRELEGALTRVVATASVRGKKPTTDLAREVLEDTIKRSRHPEITLESIRRISAKFFGLRESDLTSARRSRAVAFPRQVAMYMSRLLTSASLAEIGEAFARTDHTTVMHAHRKIANLSRTDPKCAAMIESLRQQIESGEK